MPPRSSRESTLPRRRPTAWAAVILLTVGSTAIWWVEFEESRCWHETHGYHLGATRMWTQAQPVPARPWSAWPRWVDEWRGPVERHFELVQAGSLFLGLGLTWLTLRRDRELALVARRQRRRGPGEVAIAISTGWMAIGTLCALDSEFVLPRLPPAPGWTTDPWTLTVTIPNAFLTWVSARISEGLAESIAAAWIFLAMAGRWRRRPADLVERLGRGIGWTWIGTRSAAMLADLIGIIPYASW